MTSPLEAMAKAHWEDNTGCDVPWEGLTQNCRDLDIRRMRAALLALAEVDIPQSILGAGRIGVDIGTFRSMLRSIAEGER